MRYGAFLPLPPALRRVRRCLIHAVVGVLAWAAGAVLLVPACFGLSAATLVWSRFRNPGWSARRERVVVAAAASAGSVAGLGGTALVNGFDWTSPLQGPAALACGVVIVPVAAWATDERRWEPPELLRRAGVRSRWTLFGVVLLAAVPVAAYILAWLRLPDADAFDALRLAFVGVVAWPVAAAALRDELLRSALWPPWWAAAQVVLGIPLTTAIVLQRAGNGLLPALVGVLLAGLLLLPATVWIYRHAQRRSPGRLPRVGTILSFAEALAPAFDPAIRNRILAHVARHRFRIGPDTAGQVDEADRPTVERALSAWFTYLRTWSLSRRHAAYLAIEFGTLVVCLLVPVGVVAARVEPSFTGKGWASTLGLFAAILALGALAQGRRNSPGRWIRLVAVLVLLEALGIYAGVAWGARDAELQRAFTAAVTMAGGALPVLAVRWALLNTAPVRVRDWATAGRPVPLAGNTVLTALYLALLAELSWLREPWTYPVLRRDLAARLLHLADWCEHRLRILCSAAPDARTAAAEGAEALRTLRPWMNTMKNRTDFERVVTEVRKLAVQAAGRVANPGTENANPSASSSSSSG